jgi:hypothetical protein
VVVTRERQCEERASGKLDQAQIPGLVPENYGCCPIGKRTPVEMGGDRTR